GGCAPEVDHQEDVHHQDRCLALLREDHGRPPQGARQATRRGPTGRCTRGVGGALDRIAHVAFLPLSAVPITYRAVTDAPPSCADGGHRARTPRVQCPAASPDIKERSRTTGLPEKPPAPGQPIGPECLMSFCSVV